jgi:hypothetical protein
MKKAEKKSAKTSVSVNAVFFITAPHFVIPLYVKSSFCKETLTQQILTKRCLCLPMPVEYELKYNTYAFGRYRLSRACSGTATDSPNYL